MNGTTTDGARDALETVGRAQRQVSDEPGLPRWYWWLLAAGWIVLGVLGEFTYAWIVVAATVLFGAGNSLLARRLYDGTRPTAGVHLRRTAVSRKMPWLVLGVLIVMIAVTIGVALLLNANGMENPGIGASVLVAAIVGFGGPDLLRWARRLVGA